MDRQVSQEVEFAEDYPRNDQGWVKFPSDVSLRRQLFVPEVMEHPAKANVYLIQEIVRYTSKPGDRVMDVNAGTGTIMVACQMDRRVTMIELSQLYSGWILASAEKMGLEQGPDYWLFTGDCRSILPLPDHQAIIFSPPYAGTFKQQVGQKLRGEYQHLFDQYQAGEKGNLGELNPFYYNIEMGKVYQKCYDSLVPGGILTLIIKDAYLGNKLEQLGYRHIQFMMQQGFEMWQWEQWESPGTQFRADHKAKGHRTVDYEHIIMMRKPV